MGWSIAMCGGIPKRPGWGDRPRRPHTPHSTYLGEERDERLLDAFFRGELLLHPAVDGLEEPRDRHQELRLVLRVVRGLIDW